MFLPKTMFDSSYTSSLLYANEAYIIKIAAMARFIAMAIKI